MQASHLARVFHASAPRAVSQRLHAVQRRQSQATSAGGVPNSTLPAPAQSVHQARAAPQAHAKQAATTCHVSELAVACATAEQWRVRPPNAVKQAHESVCNGRTASSTLSQAIKIQGRANSRVPTMPALALVGYALCTLPRHAEVKLHGQSALDQLGLWPRDHSADASRWLGKC